MIRLNVATRIKYTKEILDFVPIGSFILDVGCGDGFLVNYALNTGFDVIGIDLLPKRNKHCMQTNVFSLPKHWFIDFDTIILNHVFEHFDNPIAFLKHIEAFQGTLIITVPNIGCWLYKFLGKRWYGANNGVGGHEIMYTPETLRFILENHGYKVKILKTGSMYRTFPINIISKLFALLGKGDNIICVAERKDE